MNAQELAEAVIHWLTFERLCGRAQLFSEAALRMPVGQFLMTSQDHLVIPEFPMPSGNGKAIDYCLKRQAGDAVVHAVESKWVREPVRPTMADEIFDDIYRLATVQFPQAAPCQRWLLVAGETSAIKTAVFDRELNAVNSRVSAFAELLPAEHGEDGHHRIYTLQGEARAPHAAKWKSAAEKLGHDRLVSSISTNLVGRFPNAASGTYSCYVWRITLPRGWGSRFIRNLFPPPHEPQTLV